MKPEAFHEIQNVCAVLVLSGLRKNPYPLVNKRQELRWQRAVRREIIGFIHKNYGKRTPETAANFPMLTLH